MKIISNSPMPAGAYLCDRAKQNWVKDADGNIIGQVGDSGLITYFNTSNNPKSATILTQKFGLPYLGQNVYISGDSTALIMCEAIATNLVSFNSQSTFGRFNNLRNGAHIVVGFDGTSGFKFSDFFFTVAADGLTQIQRIKAARVKPDVVIVSLGANDFFISGLSSNVVLALAQRLCEEIALLGATLVLFNGYARANTTVGSNVWSAAGQAQFDAYRAGLPTIFAQFSQHYLIDTYSISSGDTGLTSGYQWTYDGLHPNTKAARAYGQLMHTTLPSSAPGWNAVPGSLTDTQSGSSGSRSITNNGIITSAIGPGLPATFTSEFNTNCTVSYSVIANPNPGGLGNALQAIMTVTANGAAQFLVSVNDSVGAAPASGQCDRYVGSAVVSSLDPNGISQGAFVRAQLSGPQGATDGWGNLWRSGDTSTAIPHPAQTNERLVTAPTLALPGINNARISLGGGAGANALAGQQVTFTFSDGYITQILSDDGMKIIPGRRLLGILRQANLASSADQAIQVIRAAKYRITDIDFTNASTTPVAAAGALYTAAAKGGTALVSAATTFTGMTASNVVQTPALSAGVATTAFTAQILYLSLTTPNAAALTCDIYVWGYELPI